MADLGSNVMNVAVAFFNLPTMTQTYSAQGMLPTDFDANGQAQGTPETGTDPRVDIVDSPIPDGAPQGTKSERWFTSGTVVTRIPVTAGAFSFSVSVRKNPIYVTSWAFDAISPILPKIELYDVKYPRKLLASDVMNDVDDTWVTLTVVVTVPEKTVLLLRRSAAGLFSQNLSVTSRAYRDAQVNVSPPPPLCYWSWFR